jgi:L-rhamnonate dehydratase
VEAIVKITDVIAVQLRLGEVQNVFDGTQDVLIVQVSSDEGLTGFGEVVSSSCVARAAIEAPRSGAGRHGLREIVRGLDPRKTEEVWRAMYEGTAWYGRRGVVMHAMAGIDVALWDLKAQAAGLPLHRLLSAEATRNIRAYASVLWGDTIEQTMQLASHFRQAGFRAVKFGFGPIGTSLEQDLGMVGAARRALGPKIDLFVDVGRRWDADTAIRLAVAFQPFDVGWIEEPLHPDDLDGYRRVAAASPIPIAGGETEETVAQFRSFLDAGLRVIQPDLGRVGLTQALQISALARKYQARCVPHCFGSGINTTASIHWMCATGGDLVEYPMRTNALCRDLMLGVPAVVDGYVCPTDAPGLEVHLTPEIVERYRYA